VRVIRYHFYKFVPTLLLKGFRTGATSPSSLMKAALAKPRTSRSFMTYAVSGILALALHVSMAYIHEPDARGDPQLTIFVKSK
jgi:nucleoporin NDC1